MKLSIYANADVTTANCVDIEIKNGTVTKSLNNKNEVSLSAKLESYIEFPIGSAIQIMDGNNIYTDAEVYVLNQLPTVTKKSETWFEYSFTFQSLLYNFNRIAFRFNGQQVFPFTGTASTFLSLILENIGAAGLIETWSAGTCEETEFKTIEFNEVSCLGALTLICDEFDLEYEYAFSDLAYTLSLSKKVGTSTAIVLEYGKGKGLYEIVRTNVNSEQLITRLYYQGSEQNVPSGYGHKYLQGSAPYIESANIAAFGRHDAQKTFDEIFPARKGTVSGFVLDGFYMTDALFPFDLMEKIGDKTTYLILGTKAKINFLTGNCAGITFEIEDYDHSTKTFKLIPFDHENGYRVPNEVVYPEIGDTYTLTDITLPQSYITDAESSLDATALEYLALYDTPRVAYELKADAKYFTANGIRPRLGDIITVNNADVEISNSVRVIEMSYPISDTDSKTIKLSDVRYTTIARAKAIKAAKAEAALKSAMADNSTHNMKSAKTTSELKSAVFDYKDQKFVNQNVRKENIDPCMLALDSGELQFSMAEVQFTPNFGGNKDSLYHSAGTVIHHSINAKYRTEIEKLTGDYTPQREWIIEAGTTSVTGDSTGYFVYLKIPTAAGQTTATIIADSNHLWAKSQEGYILYKIGYLSKGSSGARTMNVLWGGCGASNGIQGVNKYASLLDVEAPTLAHNRALVINDAKDGVANSCAFGGYDDFTWIRKACATSFALSGELITNPQFESNLAGWTVGAGWSWEESLGSARHTAGNTEPLSQSVATESKNVQIQICSTGATTGTVTVSFDNAPESYLLANGEIETIYFTCSSATGVLNITPSSDYDGKIIYVEGNRVLGFNIPSQLVGYDTNYEASTGFAVSFFMNSNVFGVGTGAMCNYLSGKDSLAFGAGAAPYAAVVDGVTILGAGAAASLKNGNNVTIIGANIDCDANCRNYLNIAGLIEGDLALHRLDINGNLKLHAADQTGWYQFPVATDLSTGAGKIMMRSAEDTHQLKWSPYALPTALWEGADPETLTYKLMQVASNGAASWIADNSTYWNAAYNWGNHANAGYLTEENDPVFSSWYNTYCHADNWDAAYNWGNHASAGYIAVTTPANGDMLYYNNGWQKLAKGADLQWLQQVSGLPSWQTLSGVVGNFTVFQGDQTGCYNLPVASDMTLATKAGKIMQVSTEDTHQLKWSPYQLPTSLPDAAKIVQFNADGTTQYIDVPAAARVYPGAGIAVSTGSGWGTSIADNSTYWNEAYGWGNHNNAGYLKSENDPVFEYWLDNIAQVFAWNLAYSWGDHSLAGYIVTPTEPANGDILYYNNGGFNRLQKGTDGQVLKLASGLPSWADVTASVPGTETLTYASSVAVNWNGNTTKSLTLTGACTLTYGTTANYVVRLVVSGNYSLTLPSGSKIIAGTYDGSKTNVIDLIPAGGSVWVTINQEA